MGFDNIDKKFAKPKAAIVAGPWYTEAIPNPEKSIDVLYLCPDPESMFDIFEIAAGNILHVWKIATIEEFHAVRMPRNGEHETKRFDTEAEAKAWVAQRETEMQAADEGPFSKDKL